MMSEECGITWRRYFVGLIAAFASVLAAGSTINYSIDTLGHFSHATEDRYVDRYSEQLVTSEFGLVWIPFDRGVKLRIAERSDSDCYVVGSSQIIEIDRETMPLLANRCERVINLGIFHGAFEDFV